MLRDLWRALALGALVACVVVPSVAAGPAAAEPGGCRRCGAGDPAAPPPPATGGSASDGSIAVQVTQTSTSGGVTGAPTSRAVYVPPVCSYRRLGSGAEYWDALSQYGWDAGLLRQLPPAWRFTQLPGADEHATDTEGAWYVPGCRADRWAGTPEGLAATAAAFDADHPPVYVSPGQPVPQAAVVPPEVLAQIAYDAMELPAGRVDWNPRLAGNGATIVGFDTWVWLADAPSSVQVTAELAGTWARVDAVLAGIDVDADGAQPVSCTGPGTPWAPGADGARCAVRFERSSANQPRSAAQALPTSTMEVAARWTASWVSSADPTPRELDGQTLSAQTEIPVAEVQAVVTGG